jgi:hypothetical protein
MMPCGCRNKSAQTAEALAQQKAAEARRAELRDQRAKQAARENAKKLQPA